MKAILVLHKLCFVGTGNGYCIQISWTEPFDGHLKELNQYLEKLNAEKGLVVLHQLIPVEAVLDL